MKPVRIAGLGMVALTAAIWLQVPAGGAGAPARYAAELDRWLVASGYGIELIAVEGHRFTPDGDIFAAIGLDEPISHAGFDAAAAEARIGRLPWIESARVTRVLPGGVAIRVRERTPFAVWQLGHRFLLIDRSGRTLAEIRREAFPGLFLVQGAGAAAAAAEFQERLAQFPDLERRTVASHRIGGRRWSLRFDTGVMAHLPADDEAAGLAQLARLEGQHGLLGGRFAEVDLRLERVVVRASAKSGSLADADRGKSRRGI